MERRITAMLRCRGSGPPEQRLSGGFRLGKKQDVQNRAIHSSPGQVRRAWVETMAFVSDHSCSGFPLAVNVIHHTLPAKPSVWLAIGSPAKKFISRHLGAKLEGSVLVQLWFLVRLFQKPHAGSYFLRHCRTELFALAWQPGRLGPSASRLDPDGCSPSWECPLTPWARRLVVVRSLPHELAVPAGIPAR